MKMKKVILGIFGAAIIALAAVNLNLTLNSGSNVDLTIASLVSLAKGESGDGGCDIWLDHQWYWDNDLDIVEYHCVDGNTPYCLYGSIICMRIGGSWFCDNFLNTWYCNK